MAASQDKKPSPDKQGDPDPEPDVTPIQDPLPNPIPGRGPLHTIPSANIPSNPSPP